MRTASAGNGSSAARPWSMLAWCCVVSSFAIMPLLAGDLFVDDDDPACGGHGPCFPRIQDAVDASQRGDTVRVYPGTYYEHVRIDDTSLSLLAEEGPEVTIIDGQGTLASTVTVYSGFDNDLIQVQIRGFTIQNGGKDFNLAENGYGIAVLGFGNMTARIERNVIRDNPVNGGIFIYPIDSETFEAIIDGNTILRSGIEGGIAADFDYGRDYIARIRNNIVAFNTGAGIVLRPGSFEVVNNTIYGNGVGVVAANMASVRVTNNILYGNTSAGRPWDLNLYFVGGGGPTASPSFNIIGDGQFNGVNGNTSQNPLLVAPQAGDFHLDPGSPAIDAGTNDAAQGANDFEGDPRIWDGNGDGTSVVDRGADEYSTNNPPIAEAADEVVECTGPEGAVAMLDGSRSSDADSTAGSNDDIVLFEWYEDFGTASQRLLGAGETLATAFSFGSHAVTLKVTDRAGKSDIAATTVTVVDTTPPYLECPTVPAATECEGTLEGGAYVPLFASTYDACGEAALLNDQTEVGADASRVYPVGSTTVNFTSTDPSGNQAACSLVVNVVDTMPPDLVLQVDPQILWPPDRSIVPVAVRWVTQDACEHGAVAVQLVSAVSSEPDTGRLKGFDIQGAEIGTADGFMGLRAERNGQGPGRVYTLTYHAVDATGNITTGEVTVVVPRDQQSSSPQEVSPRSPARRIRAGRARVPAPVATAPR